MIASELAKPLAIKVLPEGIPDELKEIPQWVCWKYVLRNGKWTKFPIDAKSGNAASSTDLATWTDFLSALKASKEYDGILLRFLLFEVCHVGRSATTANQ